MIAQFSTVVDGREVHMLYENESRPCYLYIRYVAADVVRVDETFTNFGQASAVLRDELGYRDAVSVLDGAGVPRSSRLWHLNHDGPPCTR